MLPPEILTGTMLISVQDNRFAQIENYKSIVEYNASRLRLQGKNGRLIIDGEKLELLCYSIEECWIKGKIHNISYEPNP